MHLVSRNRYPNMHMMPPETAVEYLASAPRVCQSQPMHWTFLDGPGDGTVMLTWQPMAHMGNNFASDGYVWADAEQGHVLEVRGYYLFIAVVIIPERECGYPQSQTLSYRVLQDPQCPPTRPFLWIVHYSRAPQNDQIPANRIPPTQQVQASMTQRRYLQSQGQLARKEFLLHDRNNWPTINFPAQMGQQAFAQPQAAAYQAGPQGRPGYYPPQGHPAAAAQGTPQGKVPRAHRASSAAIAAAAGEFALEDEDVSSGDVLDALTPREVSKMRYVQHHEWMEEIFASPYSISQITPVSLGLGRKGELQSLTDGFFDAPSADVQGDENVPDATKLEPAKAEEFADRVAKKVADMTSEIEKLKKQHAQRMERFNRSSIFKGAELRLREAATNPEESGPEVWRLEGRIIVPSEEDAQPQVDFVEEKAKYKVDDVVRDVENTWKKQIVPEPKVSCVEKGGLLEKIEPEQKEPESFTNDMVLDDSTHLLNEFGSPAAGGPSEQPASGAVAGDVEMDLGDQLASGPGENSEWVMVNNENKEGGSGGENSLEGGFDFTNIDSAGDALAAYTEQNDGLDLPDLENSAFGDAFHASDNEHSHHPDADDIS
ncbi:hypothetical protein N7450_003827 [Penicillium hetheringtonii]|uniref:DUF1750-domain-containing protein n=1 Tax=Penicillium hetheringtonii TaxID=911720 RepID=A0AAD6DPN3_9EURO|nr:hypothetical protein N7450_003827 [Penicillium hetheringtonii]